MSDITENYNIVINESGGRTVKRSLDDIADSAQRGAQPVNNLKSSLSELAIGALKTTAGLAGIGLSIAGIIDAVRGIAQATIKFQQFNSTLLAGSGSAKAAADALQFVRNESQRLGLDLSAAADQFGKLSAASHGTALEGKATRDIFTAVAQAATVMGLSTDQTSGSLLAIQQMISKGTVSAEELRGQLGERLPGAFQIAARSMNLTTAELSKLVESGKLSAEELLPKLAAELNKTFGPQAEQSAQGLSSQINRMNTAIFDLKIAIGESGLINFLSSGIELATKLGNALTSAFGGGQKLNAVEKQISLIQSLEEELESLNNKAHIPFIGDLLFDKKQADLLKFRIESATEDLQKLKASISEAPAQDNVIKPLIKPTIELTEAQKQAIKARENFIAALTKEAQTVGLTSIEIKRLEAAQLGVSASAKPMIDRIESVTKEMDAQKESARKLADDLRKIESINESVRTPEEKFTAAKEELDRLREAGLSQESYTRALNKSEDELLSLKKTGRDVFNNIDQYAIQAARNIQTSLANFLFDPFQDGLKGMVNGVINAVRRMVAEFAAMKIAQVTGLSDLFETAGSASNAISGTSLLSTGSNLLNFARSGFGIGNVIGKGASFLGSATGLTGLSSFGAGASGAASAGVFGAGGQAFLGGAGTAIGGTAATEFGAMASMGSMAAAAAGPLAIAAAADIVFRMLAGNKSTGSKIVDSIPIVGSLGSLLFGHGPMKFREEALIGNATGEGFNGRVTDVFRAKGGLFVGNKHKEQAAPNEAVILDLFDTTLKGFGDSVKGFAQNLGLSTDSVTNFSKEIDLRSEKEKTLTEDAIKELLNSLGNELAGGILKQVDIVAKSGETNIQTLGRLSKEFDTLNLAALATGRSLKEARDAVLSLPIAFRTQVVDSLGGVDAAGQKINFFIDNFLSDTDKFKPMFESLDIQMQKLGFSASMTREDFTKLVQSIGTVGGVSAEQFTGLLDIVGQFDTVDKLRTKLSQSTSSLVEQEQTLLDIRNELSSTYQRERSELQNTIAKFSELADQLKGFREGLLLGELSPLTPWQKLEEARNQFNQVRLQAASGDQEALAKLPNVAQEFLKASQTYNASSGAFVSDFKLVQNVLKNAEGTALSQAEITKRQLTALDDSVTNLVDINQNTKTTVDLIREINVKALTGPGNPTISSKDIQGFLAANPNMTPQQIANAATKFGVSGQQLIDAGVNSNAVNLFIKGSSITDKQIRDFVNSGVSPRQIYDTAVANGISSRRLSTATGIALSDIEKFVSDNGLPSFARGTDFIARSGLAMVHRAEAIVPSSTTEEIKKLREEIVQLREEQNQQTGDMISATDITNKQNARAIAEAMAEIESRRQWSDRSKARIA